MKQEHIEIVEALDACDTMSEFNRMLVDQWARQRDTNRPLSEIGERHIYRLLYQYRNQAPEVYEKYKDLPEVVKHAAV